jgi:hypothetical protein
MSAFSVTLTIGVIILFAGFLLSTASSVSSVSQSSRRSG